MSYAMASALQKAVFARLGADGALAALVGGALHDFEIGVVTDEAGFAAAKAAAVAVSDALVDAPLALERGRLVALNFVRARARRGAKGAGRRIDLRFRARVEDE